MLIRTYKSTLIQTFYKLMLILKLITMASTSQIKMTIFKILTMNKIRKGFAEVVRKQNPEFKLEIILAF